MLIVFALLSDSFHNCKDEIEQGYDTLNSFHVNPGHPIFLRSLDDAKLLLPFLFYFPRFHETLKLFEVEQSSSAAAAAAASDDASTAPAATAAAAAQHLLFIVAQFVLHRTAESAKVLFADPTISVGNRQWTEDQRVSASVLLHVTAYTSHASHCACGQGSTTTSPINPQTVKAQ